MRSRRCWAALSDIMPGRIAWHYLRSLNITQILHEAKVRQIFGSCKMPQNVCLIILSRRFQQVKDPMISRG